MVSSLFGGGGSNRSTTTVKPWGAQRPFMRQLFGEAQDVYENRQGPAGFTADQTAAMDQMRNLAGQNVGAGTLGAGTEALMAQLGGTSGPSLEAMLQSASRPVMRQYEEQVLPGIRQQAQASGGLGGSRQGVAEGIAARGATDAMSDMAVNIQNQQAGRQLQALGMVPSMMSAEQQQGLFSPQLLAQIGAQRQQQEQREIDDPWRQLQAYQGIVGNPVGQTTVGPGTSQAANIFGGGLAGAGLAQTMGMSNPWTAGLAIGGGLLGSMF